MAIGDTSAQFALRDPDVRLMLRVRDADDAGAFAELVERYQHRLVAVMNHIVAHADEAEDLAQEVFLRVYRTRAKYRPRAKFSTWLYTIANNLALNHLRSRQRRRAMPLEVSESGSMSVDVDEPALQPTQQVQQRELAEVVQEALHQLNERQRVAVVLNKFEDMGYADIADVMGLSVEAVKSLLSRARAQLRKALEPYIHMDDQPVAQRVADEE